MMRRHAVPAGVFNGLRPEDRQGLAFRATRIMIRKKRVSEISTQIVTSIFANAMPVTPGI
jgi:hypothetical protein